MSLQTACSLITENTFFATTLHNVLSNPFIIKYMSLQLCMSTGVCIHMSVYVILWNIG